MMCLNRLYCICICNMDACLVKPNRRWHPPNWAQFKLIQLAVRGFCVIARNIVQSVVLNVTVLSHDFMIYSSQMDVIFIYVSCL